ncbi:hypothetical protein GH810_07915 [Acetobacterium paludosum]|uniref:Uncharacterized protein n=1 Tax=Acetobacterium paludosum TaxID=52693 RepID=A0A923HT94_9FIRM|nr:hypothetical protein [Acetobacterium paludosum]MBC3888233.1 hypothetical protein [Acetobacterium paludosum]
MNIYIQDEVLEFDNDPKTTKQIFDAINEYLNKRELKFSHLIIDGISVYENLFTYFSDNINKIEKVEVVLQTIPELVNETIITTDNYINNAIPLITELAEEFYQQPNDKTWLKLNDLFEGIQWVIESLSQIDSIKNLNSIINNYEIWNEYVQEVSKLSTIISELEVAIVGKDLISIGDMVLYEITPAFESMSDKLGFLLPKMGDSSVS